MGEPKDSEPPPATGLGVGVAAAEGAVAPVCANTDLQYVSIQLEGITFGGWYRLLADGRMELIARVHLVRDGRSQATLREQAESMLSELIRAERRARGSP